MDRSLAARLPLSSDSAGNTSLHALTRAASALVRRWYDNNAPVPYAYTPLSIPGDSVAVTKYRAPGISDRHVIGALVVICSVAFLSLLALCARRIHKRRMRAREALEADIAFQALEKGMGGGNSPPMELDAPSLWGKGLSFFNAERRRGSWSSVHETDEGKRQPEQPRPALLRERSDVSTSSFGSTKSIDSTSSGGSTSSHAEFGVVNRVSRSGGGGKPGFERKKSKLRLVRVDLDHVPEEDDDADGGPYPSSPMSPSTPSSTSSTTFPSSTASSNLPSSSTSPLPPSSPTLPSPTPSGGGAVYLEPLPTGLRPLSLSHSPSQLSMQSFHTASPALSISPLNSMPDDDEDEITPAPAGAPAASVAGNDDDDKDKQAEADVRVLERRPSDTSN